MARCSLRSQTRDLLQGSLSRASMARCSAAGLREVRRYEPNIVWLISPWTQHFPNEPNKPAGMSLRACLGGCSPGGRFSGQCDDVEDLFQLNFKLAGWVPFRLESLFGHRLNSTPNENGHFHADDLALLDLLFDSWSACSTDQPSQVHDPNPPMVDDTVRFTMVLRRCRRLSGIVLARGRGDRRPRAMLGIAREPRVVGRRPRRRLPRALRVAP